MARINLLPWRAERRKQRQKEFGVMLAFAALAGLALWFLVNSYYNGQISGQEERNAYLQTPISQAATTIKAIEELSRPKSPLLTRTDCLDQPPATRARMGHT